MSQMEPRTRSTGSLKERIVRYRFVLAALLVVFSSAACGTVTKLTNVWRSPSVTAGSMHHILVVGIAKTATGRRSFEDRFTAALGARNVDAVPSYRLLPSDDRLSEAEIRHAIKNHDFDGVIVTRLVSVDEESVVVPPRTEMVPRRGYYGYYGRSWDVVHTPGYIQTTTIVSLDTQLYDAETADPVWGARSETFDPESVDEAIDSVTAALSKRLAKDELLP